MFDTADRAGPCLSGQMPPGESRSRGGVKRLNGGDSLRPPFGRCRKDQGGIGEVSEPTVKIRTKETPPQGQTGLTDWPRLGASF